MSRLSDLLDWRDRRYDYWATGVAGRLGTAIAWGELPAIGQVLILRTPEPHSDGCCYRVLAVRPAFDNPADGFTLDLEHVPGHEIERWS